MKPSNVAIIAVGSNIDAERNIALMLQMINEKAQLEKISEMVTTEPIGITDQPIFTNGAIRVTTPLEKEALTLFLKEVEDRLGRDRSLPRFGPRTMDLDIVVWNGEIVDDDYYTRDFLKHAVDSLMEQRN